MSADLQPAAGISAVIITKNEAAMIGACLESLSFCDEIIVIDSFSNDGTQDIARSFGAKVIEREFKGFGDQKEFGRREATHEWVLSIDADERITPELAAEIQATISQPSFSVYKIPRLSYFLGSPFRHSGWWPDEIVRLFRRDAAYFGNRLVHEELFTEFAAGRLTQHMLHYSVRSVEQALDKAHHYSLLGAQQIVEAKKRVSIISPFTHAFVAFVKTYIFKRGFLGGVEGFVNACIHMQTVYWKYMLAYLERTGKAGMKGKK